MKPMSNILTTSDEILASARALIMTGGYNGFSYADIAAVVGIRKASIHHHFPSKTDLVRTLVVRYREDAEAGIAYLEQQVRNPLALLQTYAGHWAQCIEDASLSRFASAPCWQANCRRCRRRSRPKSRLSSALCRHG